MLIDRESVVALAETIPELLVFKKYDSVVIMVKNDPSL